MHNILYTLTTVSALNLLAIECKSFDLIIIPVPKGAIKELEEPQDKIWTKSRSHVRNDKLEEPPAKIWQRTRGHGSDDKLDVEHYDEPTELPDIDNLDYNVDRGTRNDDSFKPPLRNDYEYQNYGDFKIVGGIEVDINLYPYHVGYGTNCGGAIIDKKYVLTAGHCGKKPYVRVGSKYMNLGKKVLVKNSVIHPLWFAKNKEHPFDYDFQILELVEPLKFDDNIQAIKVAHIEDMVIGKVITVTGWGNTEENGPYSKILRAVRVPIISKEHCQTVPFPYFRGSLTARMFCAGFSEGKKDACQGDSGGPAVSNDRLLGMVSFGYGCATPGSYGVYSKVAKVRDWIENVTGLRLL